MNIAFINFPMIERDYSRKERSQFSGEIGNHLGIGYIGAVSRAAGHDVTLYDCPNEDISFSQLMDHINSSTYNLIGISLYYPTRHLLTKRIFLIFLVYVIEMAQILLKLQKPFSLKI